MSSDAGFWLAIALMFVGCEYVQHLENVDCRAHGGKVVESKCEGAK